MLSHTEHPLTEGSWEGGGTAAEWTFTPQAYKQTALLPLLPYLPSGHLLSTLHGPLQLKK